MRTQEEVYRIASEQYAEGCAVVDLKYNEVFRFSKQTDAQVIVEWPRMFRLATEEEARSLKESGKGYVSL